MELDHAADQPTDLPAEGATLQARSWGLAVVFAPEIRLRRSSGLDFARRLTENIEPTDVNLGEQAWVFTKPTGENPNSKQTVTVTPNIVRIEAAYPVEAQELFETRSSSVLQQFSEQFSPTAIIQAAAMIRGQLQIDGDARKFLAHHVAHLEPEQVGPLQRPIHGIGLSLFLPPFSIERKGQKKETTDWQLQLKIESLLQDPSQLYLEADAHWPQPTQWSKEAIRLIPDRLRILNDYLRSEVISFLGQKDQEE